METEGLIKSLKEHKVKFVIIGATAFPVHGYARATLDVDIYINPEADNARRTWNALHEFGYDVFDMTINYILTKKSLIGEYA